jgi:hypothetical protein
LVQVNDESVMTRFLMGEPTRDEREAVEERLSTDPEYFEELSALEDELILKWHRGELSTDERRRFSEAYLSSPPRRARVEAARHLIDAAARWAKRPEPESVWLRVARWIDSCRRVPQVLVATALIFFLGTLPLSVYEAVRWRAEARRLQQAAEAARPAAASRLAVAVLLPQGAARLGRGAAEAPAREVRQDAMTVLVIPRDTGEVQLHVALDDADVPHATSHLSAELRGLEGGTRQYPGPLQTTHTGAGSIVKVVVAAGDLPGGDYVLWIHARGPVGDLDVLATRTFRVVRE